MPVLLVIVLLSCVEPFFFEDDESTSLLTIEGQLFTDINRSYVKIGLSSDYVSDPNNYIPPSVISDASVRIYNDGGGVFTDLVYHAEEQAFKIVDQDFQVEIGNEYYLEVIWNDNQYLSTKEMLFKSPSIDSLYFEFDSENERLNIFLDIDSLSHNYIQWEWDAVYQVLSFLPSDPDTFTCCTRCFVPAYGNEINITDQPNLLGSELNKVFITSVNLDRPTKYLLTVDQISLTKRSHDFLTLLRTQKESTGGLFDPLPFEINGNISNTQDLDQKVLGYFFVSDISNSDILLDRREYFTPSVNYSNYSGDCRDLNQADTITPPNWR